LQLGKLGSATDAAERAARGFNLTALRQNQVVEGVSSKLRGMLLSITALAGAGGMGLLLKRGYDYDQQLASVRNSIAGILAANRQYVDSNGQLLDANAAFQAGLSETDDLLVIIQKRAIDTAATVPQLSDAFETALNSAKASGLKQDLNAILETTVRIVQAASAFGLPLDQLRQEINSLFSGQITEDSQIAKKLGFDSASVKKAIAAGTLYAEIMKRTEALSVAASAQANTLSGVLTNVAEMIDSTVAKAMHKALGGVKGFIADIGQAVTDNAPKITAVATIVTDAVGGAISRVAGWVREHSDLLREIGAISLVAVTAVAAYGVIGAAIAALSSPIGLTIAGIIALALLWEKAREFGEIEVHGRPISAYVRATWDLVGGVTAAFVQLTITQFQLLWHATAGIFGSLVQIVLAPMRAATTFIASIPDSAAALLPGGLAVKGFANEVKDLLDTAAAAYDPLSHFGAIGSSVAESWSVGGSLIEQTFSKVEASLKSKERLPSIADTVFGGIASAFKKRMAEIMAAAKASTPEKTNAHASADTKPVIPEEVRKAFDEYLRFVDEVRRKGQAAGDPVAEALENVNRQRREALAKIAEAQRNAKFNGIAHDYAADVTAINASFDAQAIEAVSNTIRHVSEATLAGMRSLRTIARDISAQVESDRIAQIKDADQRALAEKLQANNDWFASETERVEAEIKIESQKQAALRLLSEEKKRRDARDRADDEKRREEQLLGFGAWTLKLRNEVREKLGPIAKQITDSVMASIDAVQSAISGFFDGLVRGQLDIGEAFDGFTKQLGSIWSRLLSNMLTKTIATGESITSQLRSMTEQMNNLSGADAGLAGAGVGSFVGGIGQAARPNSYAGVGGTVGGAIGAVIGSYFGATAVGAYIGSAIGTAIGAAIQKGKDNIAVAINASLGSAPIVSVVEKGISAAARERLVRDITRQTSDVVKQYESLIDLFPEQLRAQIRRAVKPISITGGVEDGDITDENALGSLSNFLSEVMPQGVFKAYSGAIQKGLELLGVSTGRIRQEMEYLGTLQGKELQNAVRSYVTTVSDTLSMRDKFEGPFEAFEQTARSLARETQLGKIASLGEDIAHLAASLPKLDITDQLPAAAEVNRLTQQKYEMEIAYLQRIDSIQQAIASSSQNLRDQIQLAGLDDQGKLDFDFARMRELRSQLLEATDPEQIQSITQQLHNYISQALSLAPNNADLRSQLLQIVDDVEGISGGQLAKAREAVEEQHRKTAEVLQSAADALLSAARALGGVVAGPASGRGKPRIVAPPTDPGGGDDGPPIDRRHPTEELPVAAVAEQLTALSDAIESTTARIASISDQLTVGELPPALSDTWSQFSDGIALAVSTLRSMNDRAASGESGVRSDDMRVVIELLGRIADRSDRELVISGDGAEMLRQWGFAIEERVIRRIRSDRDVIRRFADQ
jgi:hypothetical protein